MVIFENECCDCAVPGYPCLGNICPKLNVKHLYCDKCKDDVKILYKFLNGTELCKDCLIKQFDVIK